MIKLLKKIIPDTLLARLLLIFVIPVIVTHLLTTYIFYERHWNNVSEKMINYVVGEISLILYSIDNNIESDPEKILDSISRSIGLKVTLNHPNKLAKNNPLFFAELNKLHEAISGKINHPISLNYLNDSDNVEVQILLKDYILNILIPSKKFSNPTTYIFIFWMIGISGILTIIAVIFCRNQLRSIFKLAIVAEKFGKGIEIEYFKPEGAKEVRKAGIAFLQMKKRIERQIAQRTDMLAGVSHDLRTPLTRIKLQLAMLESSNEIDGINADLIEMDYMINSYLDFARGEGTEKSHLVKVIPIINQVIESYHYHKINIEIDFSATSQDLKMHLKENAIKRCLTNFINNSMKYAQKIIITCSNDVNELYISVEDNGPGITFDQRKNVFKPFYRLDSSRNFCTGGVGLGLAIARDIVTSHGGNIELSHSEKLGGLKVIVHLPL